MFFQKDCYSHSEIRIKNKVFGFFISPTSKKIFSAEHENFPIIWTQTIQRSDRFGLTRQFGSFLYPTSLCFRSPLYLLFRLFPFKYGISPNVCLTWNSALNAKKKSALFEDKLYPSGSSTSCFPRLMLFLSFTLYALPPWFSH